MIAFLIPIGISLVISIIVSIIVVHIDRLRRRRRFNGIEYVDLDTFNELESRVNKIEDNMNNTKPINDNASDLVHQEQTTLNNQTPPLDKQKSKKERKKEKYETKKTGRNGKIDQSNVPTKPEVVSYIYMNVSNRKLIVSDVSSSYYRAWKYNDVLYYEFHCEKSKMAKAINNRSVLIDPFCIKDISSTEADESNSIAALTPGKLESESYEIIDKTTIKYTKE